MTPTAPIRVFIVEDMPFMRQELESYLLQQPGFIIIGACTTVYEAIILIQNTKPDLILLDIGLPDGTGFDILERIPAQSKVIFLTAHDEYAIRAVRYGAIDYLLKPLDENKLRAALDRVISAQPLLQEQIDMTMHRFRENKVQDRIVLRSQQIVQVVKLENISYLQGDHGYTTVFLQNGKNVLTTRILKEYEELLAGHHFLRTHKSYLVNKSYIDRYHLKEGLLYLIDGTLIPVSYRKKDIVDLYFQTL